MSSTTLISLAAQAPAAANGAGMTAATLLVLTVGVLYCWWHKGTDWPTAVIFTIVGMFVAGTALGVTAKEGVAGAAQGLVSGVMGMFS
jgi:uncharacterized membrane protein YfcA